jgi:hypothetical protein
MTELFFHVEKLLFYKRHIFSVLSFFFCMPSSFHPFLVYGICLRNSPNIFSVFVYRVPVAPLLPSFASVGAPYTCALDARVSARVVHAKPSERAASFRAHTGRNVWLRMKVEDTQRAKRSYFRVSKSQLSFSCVFGSGVFYSKTR